MDAKQKNAVERELREQLVALLNITWSLYGFDSMESIAQQTGLSKATLYRLWGCLWKRPQILTLQKLCWPVGLQITLTSDGSVKTSMSQEALRRRG